MILACHTGTLESLQANLPGGETSVLQSCQILLGMDPGNLASLMDDGVGIYAPTYVWYIRVHLNLNAHFP